MAKYGNIMTVFNCDSTKVQQVKTAVTSTGAICANKENTFYIETNSKENTKVVLVLLAALNLEYLFFHNKISDGSQLFQSGIDAQFAAAVKQILL